MKLTFEQVDRNVSYDPATGVFRHKVDRCMGKIEAGERAGSKDASLGYVRLSIDGKRVWAHRVAWLLSTGSWPQADIDHINGVRDDNRLANLRDVSRGQNLQNQTKPGPGNRSGIRGVRWDGRRSKWRAEISVDNRNKFLGRFDTKAEAAAAYLKAKQQFHPGAVL